jgi:hypothetical protein
MKDSSVSRLAERELRFVEPKRVVVGGSSAFGRNHMPAQRSKRERAMKSAFQYYKLSFEID